MRYLMLVGSLLIIGCRATPIAATDTFLAISEADCTAAKLGDSIPSRAIGEPVRSVRLAAPRWLPETDTLPDRCEVDGEMAPVDRSAGARPINFRVLLPARWQRRAAHHGGGGMNGVIPNLAGTQYTVGGVPPAKMGFAMYGSDSGHQSGSDDWALNDEAVRNLAFMQMKKTHDAAMVVIERMYGARPRFNYYLGTSQGGREALTVAQRYPGDYDGVVANVPVVNFSSLMLAPALIRIQEKPLANWVTPAKASAIRAEFMRQCDDLDGLIDGVINNYVACRVLFDVKQGAPNRRPWEAKRCPGNVDPNPGDTTPAACLTDGQISTLQFMYTRYAFATPLANGVRSFGMWLPNTDVSGAGQLAATRLRGQEGAGPDAEPYRHLGMLGITAFLMQDLNANALDYVEGGPLKARRAYLSSLLDATNPDLSAFAKRGGKAIVTIGTNDTLASPGAQLDYYQSLLDTMGRGAVDRFARLFVVPQADHGLNGKVHGVDGAGKAIDAPAIATSYDRLAYLMDWVERGVAPGKQLTVTNGERSMPLCSYPAYPRYVAGDAARAASYNCAMP